MLVTVKRIARKNNYTIGHIYVDGIYICDSLENPDRGLKDSMPNDEIKRKKIPGKTAIPSGKYELTLDVISPRFGKMPFYKENANNGRLPRLWNVKEFVGVLFHCGASVDNTDGCILVGKNKIVGGLTDSKECFKSLYNTLSKSIKRHDKIWCEII